MNSTVHFRSAAETLAGPLFSASCLLTNRGSPFFDRDLPVTGLENGTCQAK